MKKKNIEKITVDESCEAGGIGGATYFHNFKSKIVVDRVFRDDWN